MKGGNTIDWIQVNTTSRIKAFYYNHSMCILYIKLNTDEQEAYGNVTPADYDEFLCSKSYGSTIAKWRITHPYIKL